MGWVKDALKELSAGRSVQIRPFGGSMSGRVESGQLVTLSPVAPDALEVGDIVLVQWKGSYLLHLVKEIGAEGFLIANNLGKTNGWVSAIAIRGKVVAVGSEPVGGTLGRVDSQS